MEKHTEKDDEVVEVSDDLQDSACKLWDICMDKVMQNNIIILKYYRSTI